MSFKGVGGSKRLGVAIAASVVVHIVAFGLFVSIGGGGGSDKSSEPPPLPPPPAELDGPAAIADSVEPAGRGEKTAPADPVVDEAPKAKSKSKPKAPEAKPAEAKKPDAKKPDVKKPEAKKPETAKPAEEADAGADSGEWKLYEVRPGDSLTKIAKKCGATVQELAKANGLKPTANLNLGQKIKIRASE